MDQNRFNDACRSLRRQQRIRLRLITGEIVTGQLLRQIPAGPHDGNLELETNRGVMRFLSSSIEAIEELDSIT